MEPIYTPQNLKAAYQLNWSLSLFANSSLPSTESWREILKTATEADGVRILECQLIDSNVLQLLVSTQPAVSPSDIVRSVKGRLQYIIRAQLPKAFRRNYHIQSLGEANADILDQYMARQPNKHPMADTRAQALLEAFQFHDASVDLTKLIVGTYGRFLNSLHIVLENEENWNEIRERQLHRIRNMITATARKKKWMLARIGMLSNHAHILLGAYVTESPLSIACTLMNNVAYVYDMKPILKFSFYAGTFGGYDRGVIRLDH